MARAKVYIANRQKKTKIPTGARLLIKRCCNAVLAYEKVEFPAEISVSFTDDEGIRQLNGSYRNKDSATDVLSFPMGEDGVYDKNEDQETICSVILSSRWSGRWSRPISTGIRSNGSWDS